MKKNKAIKIIFALVVAVLISKFLVSYVFSPYSSLEWKNVFFLKRFMNNKEKDLPQKKTVILENGVKGVEIGDTVVVSEYDLDKVDVKDVFLGEKKVLILGDKEFRDSILKTLEK